MPATAYRLLRRLRTTPIAEVFLAEAAGGALVALKRPRPERASDPAVRHLFAVEMHHAPQLQHLGLVRILDAGVNRGLPYVVEETVGPSLERVWTRLHAAGQRLPVEAVAQIGVTLAQAIGYVVSLTDADGRAVLARHGGVSLANAWLRGSSPVALGDLGVSTDPDLVSLAAALLQLLTDRVVPAHDLKASGERPSTVPPALWGQLQGAAWPSPRDCAQALAPFAAGAKLTTVLSAFPAEPLPRTPDPSLASEGPITLMPPDPGGVEWTSDEHIGGGASLRPDGSLTGSAPPRPASSPGRLVEPLPAPPPAPGALPSIHAVGEIELARPTRAERAEQEVEHQPRRGLAVAKVIAVIAALATLVGLIAFFVPALGRQLRSLRPDSTYIVSVESDPPGAEVFSDRNDLGPTPLIIPNDYSVDTIVTLRVEKHGYQPAELSFAGARTAHLRAVLKRAK